MRLRTDIKNILATAAIKKGIEITLQIYKVFIYVE